MKSFESKYGRALPPVVSRPRHFLDLSVEQFASMFHTAALGVRTGRELLEFEANRVKNSGFHFQAFNVESPYLELADEILEGTHQLMVPIGYPIGAQTLKKRMADMDYIVKHRADQCCVPIDYQAALSGRYDIIESECHMIHETFDSELHIIDILPATLFTAKELIEVGKAISNGGGYHLKVNPGYGLSSTFEELLLLRRVFQDTFILDPSGGIREIREVANYVENGFTVIHSQKTFVVIEEFRKMKEQGETNND